MKVDEIETYVMIASIMALLIPKVKLNLTRGKLNYANMENSKISLFLPM